MFGPTEGTPVGQVPRELTPGESALHYFGAELRRRRAMRGLSQDVLGRLVHHSGDTIGKVEKAIRRPTEDLAVRCDEVLGTDGLLARLWSLVEQERARDPADRGWPGRAGPNGGILEFPASAGMDGPWSLATTTRIAEDWLLGGLVDRRVFLSVSGAALAQAINIYLAEFSGAAVGAATKALVAGGERTEARGLVHAPIASVDDPLVDQIEASVPRLQVLDDERGGAAGLGYVGAQVRAVLLVLRDGGHTDATVRRLLVALADLAQLAGWKCVDAAQPGLAQRYFFTGLRAAHDAGYRPMEAHILADLAFQAASLGGGRDSVVLGEAARRVAERSTASVRASVMSRLAFAYAAAGRMEDFERTRRDAQDCLADRRTDHDPDWMYYLTPNHLDCQAGYAMILAGRRMAIDSSVRALLRKGEALLRTGAYASPLSLPSQRRALYEGAWLALGYTAHGSFHDAATVVRLTLPRLDQVRSPRGTSLLASLAADLRRRKRNQTAADLLSELEAALARQPASRYR